MFVSWGGHFVIQRRTRKVGWDNKKTVCLNLAWRMRGIADVTWLADTEALRQEDEEGTPTPRRKKLRQNDVAASG